MGAIRKAKIQDVRSMHEILNRYANRMLLLPRSLSELYDHLRDFYVIEGGGEKENIHGLCSLNISWETLGEIRSLAVSEDQQKAGLGGKLVEACLSEAVDLGLEKVFVLTMIKDFFSRFGFSEVEKSSLPHKVWADCVRCPKFPDCDEIAMVIYV